MTDSLVGHVVHTAYSGTGELQNSFCLIVQESLESVTLIPLPTKVIGKDSNGYELQLPELPADAAKALSTCPHPLTATKGVDQTGTPVFHVPKQWDAEGNPVFEQEFIYRLWDGHPKPCWEIW